VTSHARAPPPLSQTVTPLSLERDILYGRPHVSIRKADKMYETR